jgi:hypothetical protein
VSCFNVNENIIFWLSIKYFLQNKYCSSIAGCRLLVVCFLVVGSWIFSCQLNTEWHAYIKQSITRKRFPHNNIVLRLFVFSYWLVVYSSVVGSWLFDCWSAVCSSVIGWLLVLQLSIKYFPQNNIIRCLFFDCWFFSYQLSIFLKTIPFVGCLFFFAVGCLFFFGCWLFVFFWLLVVCFFWLLVVCFFLAVGCLFFFGCWLFVFFWLLVVCYLIVGWLFVFWLSVSCLFFGCRSVDGSCLCRFSDGTTIAPWIIGIQS